jgi:DNA-directed RNA polymerase specialized sigma24 family protein
MTASDQGSVPGDSDGDYATVGEVAAALTGLSQLGLNKLELQARFLVRGTSLEVDEVINTVVERLLTQDRHWHRKETIAGCFYRTMKSIVRDFWRRQQIPMVAVSDGAAGLQTDPDPEVQLVARDELSEVLKALGNDDNTAEIAVALANGDSPTQVRKRLGLTETSYNSALRRIRRRILKYKKSTGQA